MCLLRLRTWAELTLKASARSGRTVSSSDSAWSEMPSGSERLGDDEARFKDLVRLVLVLGGVGILHVEPQVWQGLVRLAIST